MQVPREHQRGTQGRWRKGQQAKDIFLQEVTDKGVPSAACVMCKVGRFSRATAGETPREELEFSKLSLSATFI